MTAKVVIFPDIAAVRRKFGLNGAFVFPTATQAGMPQGHAVASFSLKVLPITEIIFVTLLFSKEVSSVTDLQGPLAWGNLYAILP